MVERSIVWAWNRYRPREGWLPVLLLTAAIITLVRAVLEADWVPEAGVVGWTAMTGLFLSIILAKRPASAWLAWPLLFIYGLLVVVIRLASLRPPLSLIRQGWEPTRLYWLQQGALFLDRMASWFEAVLNGGRSHETIVFAFALGLLAWLLAAYAGWSTFRQGRPLLGMTLMGVALAANGYYGEAQLWWASLFVALTALLAASINFANLEQEWQASRIDYSDQIRLDLVLFAGGIAVLLLIVALILPSIPYSRVARELLASSPVKQTEDTLERVFAGVRQPHRGGTGVGVDGFVSAGMPRSYLLGNPPELYETVVMTASVIIVEDGGNGNPAERGLAGRAHWRGLSYDVYTGRGWARSNEREETVAAGNPIPQPAALEQMTISQSVRWLFGQRTARYTVGLPTSFDQETAVHWRGLEDLAWVEGESSAYQATSRLSAATAAQLRLTSVVDIAPVILSRYTKLPATVPVRVHELAQDVAGQFANPYDQARSLERFLRQYEYSLEVELPPADVDPVDFFLFEQQVGYCDYYASAMVVMARSLGLPARLGVGFLPQPPDDDGVQTIYQINGHSWAEVYFAGYGWVEFEPTAAFPSPHDQRPDVFGVDVPDFGQGFEPEFPGTPAIPAPDPQRPFRWERVALVLLAAVGLWLWGRRRARKSEQNGILWAYGHLQQEAVRLDHPLVAGQTPAEYAAGLQTRLDSFAEGPLFMEMVAKMRPRIAGLAELFISHQYGPRKEVGAAAAVENWLRLRRAFWLLRLVYKFRKKGPA